VLPLELLGLLELLGEHFESLVALELVHQ